MPKTDNVWFLLFPGLPLRIVPLTHVGRLSGWEPQAIRMELLKWGLSQDDCAAYAAFVCSHTGEKPFTPEDLLTPTQLELLAWGAPEVYGEGRPLDPPRTQDAATKK